MAEFVELTKTDALPDGAMKKVSAGGRDYLVARVAGKYYCTDLRCPHMGGDLSKGTLNGTVIECPVHHSRFELSDGRVVRWLGGSGLVNGVLGRLKGPVPLKAYEVRVEGDRVLVRL
ncbi:MAG: 3-phenylpropionate dioxygenase ferredoxin subunit [Methanocella sp. PtaU1.Bin125]|nr:MAG: 3-phenylpropionate dioxygenase ferredoxin subunit [Methanocella sp. PtaU1.Bin125]